ncbi:hypothetical protein GCM10010129_63750 [Streptomyces fumigatiscleroticus]|nr:hypothetical protein GCM10010129_63750 [Streptomyces fumigatiscleroticus]
MPTEQSPADRRAGATPGALLLCRAGPASVAQVAPLLRDDMFLAPAGEEWSVLVPEGGPWRVDDEPVDSVLTGWATALAVGAPWPVLALWWDADRAGYTLASGFRRPVGYVWLAGGTPAGEKEAMHTFAARLGLDPVLDVQALERLTEPDPEADARTRLRGLLAVLTRAGVLLPPELAPGGDADRLREAAGAYGAARRIAGAARRDAPGATRPRPRTPRPGGGPGPRALALAQLTAGVPLTVWGVRQRSTGWIVAGALLLAQSAVNLAYGRERAPAPAPG